MEENYKTKLWGGRFRGEEDKLMENFQNGTAETRAWMLKPDVQGSLAHVAMLAKVGILTEAEGKALTDGLQSILDDVNAGRLSVEGDYEDVHTFVELHLTERVGELGKKVHTARSRNDQCNTDMKLYVREKTQEMVSLVEELQNALAATAEKNPYIMPGYTHMQHAQVVTMKYYLMAYHAMFGRDKKRLLNALDVMDECPLGCGALAGTTHDIDRAFSAHQLGFSAPYANFLDGVSDRDFCVETMSVFAVIMMHLSRLAEELVLWNSAEFGFITLDDKYTTGSSIMPQKKNPDAAELVRGNCGKVYGDLVTLLTVMKGLPLAYNKDMQNDKVSWHDSMLTTSMSVAITARMVATMVCHPEKMRDTVKKGFMNATEVADYLVKKGVSFRDAHGIVGEIVLYCEDRHKPIEELSLDELLKFDPNFTADIFEYVDYDHILHKGIKKEML